MPTRFTATATATDTFPQRRASRGIDLARGSMMYVIEIPWVCVLVWFGVYSFLPTAAAVAGFGSE